jgi:hypothetical protein
VKSVSLDDDALAELMESVAWYENKEDGVGTRFLEAVHATLRALPRLKRRPLKSQNLPDASYVEVGARWPYRLIVIEEGDLLVVVAVAHHRRESGYWRARLIR